MLQYMQRGAVVDMLTLCFEACWSNLNHIKVLIISVRHQQMKCVIRIGQSKVQHVFTLGLSID